MKQNYKKINVYIQYPWVKSDCFYYKYLIECCNDDVNFINSEKYMNGALQKSKVLKLSYFAKNIIRTFTKIFYPSLLNIHHTRKGDFDLIHCAHCLSNNKNMPWVADIEFIDQLWVAKTKRSSKKRVRKVLMSNNCKRIMVWTDKVKKDFDREFPEVKDKVEVVYPILPKLNIHRKLHKGINLFFVARSFAFKGGYTAVEVIDRISKKYDNVNGIIVGDVPQGIINKYKKNKKIKFYPVMDQKDVFDKVYSIGDIFVYPGYSDSFGLAILETMSFGVPVISVNISTRKELINHGKNGFLCDTNIKQFDLLEIYKTNSFEHEKIIQEMCNYIEKLISDKKMYDSFSKNALYEINKGKFSKRKIKEKIKKIYNDALK